MRVKMLDSETGTVWPEQGFVHLRRGEIHDVPDEVGAKWVKIGLASLVPDVVVSDKTVAGNARTTTRARARSTEDGD